MTVSPASSGPIIGIDLGTTNSLIAVWRNEKAELIPNVLGEVLTPSVVSVDEDGQVLVGRAAKSRLTTHPAQTTAAFKRFMGTEKVIRLGSQSFSAPELSALVLKSLRADAESYLGEPISDAVISVPAYFNDEQRKHTRFAAELAGLNVTRLINEPTAAAMAYGLHEQAMERSLIFDLGGGTFDVTVLEYDLPLIEVHASTGDNMLGGEDFTAVLMVACLKDWELERDDLSPKEQARLWDRLEQMKHKLSSGTQTLDWTVRDQEQHWVLDDARAEKIWQPLLKRLRQPIEQAMRDSRLQPRDLDSVVMVGGATRLNCVQQLVSTLFGKLPYRHLDPDTVVALGAAAQAACSKRDASIEELILTDVCPYTLGIASQHGEKHPDMFSPIIDRNTIIPTSRVERFWTTHPEQQQVEIKIYQGERPRASDNILIDTLEIPVSPLKDSNQWLDIRFSYDINGLLEVDVEMETGAKHSKIVDRSPAGLDEEARQQSHDRLQGLKIHPRDSLPNRTLLARIERAYSQTLGDERSQIQSWLAAFEEVLGKQNKDDILRLRNQLNDALDQAQL
ncbi:Hsp70 family protein [Pokkaliibacter sp. CJK22405]|uniref:Hsp70 family protein n=1 Tax=Pokkaliibacter sp. CJK22405 TaxID=3384615 RepID=UPI003984DCCC